MFKFGDRKPTQLLKSAKIPATSFDKSFFYITINAVPFDVPLLLSKESMKKLKLVLVSEKIKLSYLIKKVDIGFSIA